MRRLEAVFDAIWNIEVVDEDAEIGVIKEVEEFGVKLNGSVFGEAEVFHRGNVPLLRAGD